VGAGIGGREGEPGGGTVSTFRDPTRLWRLTTSPERRRAPRDRTNQMRSIARRMRAKSAATMTNGAHPCEAWNHASNIVRLPQNTGA